MSLIFCRILGPLVFGWAPNYFVLGAQLAPGEKMLVCNPVEVIHETMPIKMLMLEARNFSDSFTILSLWVLGLAVSNNNESQLQTYESKTLFLMTSLQYYCIPGLNGTRCNKNLCAKDAGCAGSKITSECVQGPCKECK